ncbi:phage major capsid protein [Aeromonas dhakensis]|uniref:phage major capsid protein n=1 Tax=Aeromonas dhakensis TaxID=196024 RepID=UPI000BAAFB12|nr:phage major capsid protein [Aeromonas dhakensis]ASX13082.1 phage major capsid protein [Aeromonas dhakensis]
MDHNEILTQISDAQNTFIQKNSAEVEQLKSQVQDALEVKSQLEAASTSIQSLKSEIEQLQKAQAKGMNSMSTQEPIATLKFSDYVTAMAKAVKAGEYGDQKSILNSQDPAFGLVFLPMYSNEIVTRLKDVSPIFQYAGIKSVSGVNDETMIKIRLKEGSEIRTAVDEYKDGAITVNTGTGSFGDYKPTWTKLESKLEITLEFAQDGQIDVASLINEVPQLITDKASYVALYGDKHMKGLFSMFSSNLADAARPYDAFQYFEIPKDFGKDFDVTVSTIQAMIRSMPMAYRRNKDLPIVLAEGTFDQLTRCQNKFGPLITELYTNGYDGRILGRPCIKDPFMPEMDQPDAVVAMFGDFARAVQFYEIEGVHLVQDAAQNGGNTHVYDCMRMGLRMNDSFALKALKTPKAAK